QLALFGEELLRLCAGVTTRALLRLERKLEELRAETLHFFGRRSAYVVRLDHSTEPAGRRDGLQAGYAGAEDEHLRRRHGAGSRHEHREELRQSFGGEQRGAVAADQRLARQRVH